MPRFEPFVGLRYSPSHIRSLDDVVCPPYDVISESERQMLEARSPSNVVRLELPADDDAGDRYDRARVLLDAWRDGGVLRRDPEPCFYGYRMTFTDPAGHQRQTLGVIGSLGLEPPGSGILPHEETTPKAKTDRLQLLQATRANLSPIWGLSSAAGLSEELAPPSHPVERATDDEGVLHELWPVSDPRRLDAIRTLVGKEPVLIADGHHRYETALHYSNLDGPGSDGVMALVVELSEEQLTVQGIHRVLFDLPPGFDLAEALAEWFDITPAAPVDRSILTQMEEAGAMAVLTPDHTWLARPMAKLVEAATHDLDSSRLDVALGALPAHSVVYQHGWDNAAAAVASGQACAAVLLRPATVAQIAAISRGGVRMPAKTTFFWPKPRTGMVIRELVD